MDWNFIMDTAVATLCASIISISGMLVVNWLGNRKGYKDINTKIGNTPENKTLSQQHSDMQKDLIQNSTDMRKDLLQYSKDNQKDLLNKIGELPNTTLSGQSISIFNEIKALEDHLDAVQKSESFKRQQLTGDQAGIDQSIATLSAFSKLMIELQSENTELRQEIKEIKLENQQLRQQLELSEQENEEDLSDDPEMKLI